MSFYNLRAAALTNVNLRSLNAEFQRRARIEEDEEDEDEDEDEEDDEAEEGEDTETLNIDDELTATMDDARKSGGHNVEEQNDLFLRTFPVDP
jgi:hypothetical protein